MNKYLSRHFPHKNYEEMNMPEKQHFSNLDNKTIIDRWETTEGKSIIDDIMSQISSGKMELELEGIVRTAEFKYKCPPNKPLYDLRGIPLNFEIPDDFKFSEIYFDYASFIDKKVGNVIDFSGKSLKGVKFNNCSLYNVRVDRLNLEETKFNKCFVRFKVKNFLIIINTLFEDSIIHEMNFNKKSIIGLKISKNSKLWGFSFMNTELENCSFDNSEIHYFKFNKCTLVDCDLSYCDIYNIVIEDTFTEKSRFDKSKFFTERTKPLGIIPYASGIRPKTIMRLNQFYGSSFRNCLLDKIIFDNCDLRNCDFEGASLLNTRFIKADFNNNTTFDKKSEFEKKKEFGKASEIYRQLKLTFKENQIIDKAAQYYYREMECRRKSMKFNLKKIMYWLYWVTCGYGERILRIVAISSLLWFLSSVAYFLGRFNICYKDDHLTSFWESMYFSAVTFTTLGYGDFQPVGWLRLMASVEAVLGSVFIALFIVTYARKAIRD